MTKNMVNNFLVKLILCGFLICKENFVVGDESSINCTVGELLCPNSTICIPQHKFCNVLIDCPYGADENPSYCDDYHLDAFWDRIFSKNPKAVNDDLDERCKLEYEGKCLCRHRDLLCKNLELIEIPDIKDFEIDILDLSGNTFKVLNKKLFDEVPNNVQKMVMKHCEINEIKSSAFFGLTHLKEIYLDNNRIQSLIDCSFGENNILNTLVLSYNRIADVHADFFCNLTRLLKLDLSFNKIEIIQEETFINLQNLNELYIRGNKIIKIAKNTFSELPLSVLSLIGNKIVSIERLSFSKLPQLTTLDLGENNLENLYKGTFRNLSKLTSLTLNGNSLRNFESGVFEDLEALVSLNLEGNFYENLNQKLFAPLKKLEHVYFRRFEMCKAVPLLKDCNPKDDGISSSKHLLHNPVLRTSVWIIATVGCFGNLLVLIGRFLAKTNNVVHSLYIKNLALSDLLMGLYLFIIAIVDMKYRGVYVQHESAWRHSKTCNICGFLSTLSSVSSVFILSLVTWDRFISITKPLARKQVSAKTATLQLLILWFIAGLIAFLPLSKIDPDYFKDFYNTNGVCLPLHVHEPFQQGWIYSTVMFVIINSLALVFIIYAYARMIHEIETSGLACRSTQQSKDRDKVAKRFGIIVLTDCLCWVPIIIVKIAALLGADISKYLYAWLAIFVLPINSALNPVLYTLTTSIFQKQMRKSCAFCVKRRKKREHPSGYDSASSLSLGLFSLGGNNRRGLNYRGTQSSLMTSKENSSKKPTAV
ncbi:relaxin receptor 2 [Onthophagus taurus]|uniref:relaxin receptor 2 n=1 Tax=Onthophagus taurus TaxID=166361 RepID=UPI0039BE41D0